MPIIIDANVAHEFTDASPEAKEISSWLMTKGCVQTGGENLRELLLTPIGGFLRELFRAGRGEQIDALTIEKAQHNLPTEHMRSDDPHVIALAVAGGARILYSKDQRLCEDFNNKDLLSRPRGKCYLHAASHKHLLRC